MALTVDDVLRLVGAQLGFSRLEITGGSRVAPLACARHVAMGIMRHELGMSWNEIATVFQCDRSTVKGGVSNYEQWIQEHHPSVIATLGRVYDFDAEPEKMSMASAMRHVRKLYPKGGVRMGEDFQLVLQPAGWQYVRRCYVGFEKDGGLAELADGVNWDEVLRKLRKPSP